MAITEKERDSIRALVDESKETEEIAKQLQATLKRGRKSVDRMRAVRISEAGNIAPLAVPLLPMPKPKEPDPKE
jgi:hypothetical protein